MPGEEYYEPRISFVKSSMLGGNFHAHLALNIN